MSPTDQTTLAFRPPNRADFGQRAKAVAQLLGAPLSQAQQFLAGLYGYSDLRALQLDADKAESGHPDFPAGPYRGWSIGGDDAGHILSYARRTLDLSPNELLRQGLRLANIGLYDRAENLRRLLKSQLEAEARGNRVKGAVLERSNTRKFRAPKATDMFHHVEIAGQNFYGKVIRSDLYVTAGDRTAYLGPSVIAYIDNDEDGGARRYPYRGPGWYMCKYSSQEIKFPLEGFGQADAERLSQQFGIPIEYDYRVTRLFQTSPAWLGLGDWVRRHPIAARKRAATAEYVKNWDAAGATPESAAS